MPDTNHTEPSRQRLSIADFIFLMAVWIALLSGPVSLQARAADDQNIQPRPKLNPKAWQKAREEAQQAMAQGRLLEADSLFQTALTKAEAFGEKDYRLAESLTDLGNVRAIRGDYASAEPLFRRALAIRRGDPNRLAEAECLVDLGRTCENLHEYEEAEKCLLEAREIVDRKVGSDHPLDAICRFQLARLYMEEKDYSKAEPLFTQALELFRHPPSKVKFQQTDPARYGTQVIRMTYRPNYTYALETLNCLSRIYMQQESLEKAETCFKDAVAVAGEQPASSNADADLRAALNNLGSFYLSRTNYSQAEPVLDRLERAQEKTLGLQSPDTLRTLSALAAVCEHNSKIGDAESAYKKLLAAREKFESPDSESILTSTGDLAAFYARHEQYAAAAAVYERLWNRAQDIRSGDIRELPMLSQLAMIYAKLGKDDDLGKVYQRQIGIYEKAFGPDNKALIKPLEEYAQLLRKQKRDAEAEPIETRAKAIRMANPTGSLNELKK